MLELTNGFQERLTFDVTNGSADFNNGNFRILSGWIAIKTGFDFVCNMWDNLNRSSAKISNGVPSEEQTSKSYRLLRWNSCSDFHR